MSEVQLILPWQCHLCKAVMSPYQKVCVNCTGNIDKYYIPKPGEFVELVLKLSRVSPKRDGLSKNGCDIMSELPRGTFIVGNKLMAICSACEQIIRIDKPILGSFHLCLTPEKKERKEIANQMLFAQKAFQQRMYKDPLNGIGAKLAEKNP